MFPHYAGGERAERANVANDVVRVYLSPRGRYDGSGQGGGVGSGQAFSAHEYGPSGSHIDTNKLFKASVSFATDSKG